MYLFKLNVNENILIAHNDTCTLKFIFQTQIPKAILCNEEQELNDFKYSFCPQTHDWYPDANFIDSVWSHLILKNYVITGCIEIDLTFFWNFQVQKMLNWQNSKLEVRI